MPIIRKVLSVGDSKAITIPKSWFEYLEKENGVEIKEVAIEVNRILKIEAIFPKKEAEKNERKE